MGVTYNTGTISVANGSAAVTGSGTAWVHNIQAGWVLIRNGVIIGIVQSVNSNTSITLGRNYEGAGITGGTYDLISTGAVRQALAEKVQELIDSVQAYVDGPLAGLFAAGTLAEPGMAFAVDPDTGLRRRGANSLALVAGGVDQLGFVGGVATGAGVQANALDNTPGRLLLPGAFGWGAESQNIGDASVVDNSIVPGVYSYVTAAGSSGGPSDVTRGTLIHSRRTTAGGETQLLIVELSNPTSAYAPGEVLSRGRTSGAWPSWARPYYRSNILGTVAQSSGVPTGAVIEKGTNANGEYVRFADGTQICAVKEFSVADTGAVTWTYPAVFGGATDVTVVAVGSNGTSPIVPAVGNAATTGVIIRLFSGSTRVTDVANLMAFGRWF